ncbi:SinI family autotransporter-associated protein [Rahnella woolbedingensis]|uniref:Intimin-like protein SinH n=1 Tax=Rahnella woolbedingensis TaxID=1510574 RepID=A0A419N3C7_9GAMM|nr:SinI family autotransporter-associated protein [Rahnella woolbedingensis]RJT37414.1 hypothetical protein D6C13_21920 [Rahnella woolbedingensis]
MKTFNKTLLATLLLAGCSHFAFADVTGSAGQIIGTKPVLRGTGAGATDHTISFANGHESGSVTGMAVGDKITLSYKLIDSEGDTDNSTSTIQWFTSSDGKGKDKKIISDAAGKSSYTLVEADAGLYIGAEIVEKTSTGLPTDGLSILVDDISQNDPSDNIPDGPVVGGKVATMIVDTTDPDTNLIGKSNSSLILGHTYQFKIWYDTNNNNVWDAGEVDASTNYSYSWNFDGTSATTGTAGGKAVSSTDNKDLTLPTTNTDAKNIFATAGADGIQGYQLQVDYTAKVKGVLKSGSRKK